MHCNISAFCTSAPIQFTEKFRINVIIESVRAITRACREKKRIKLSAHCIAVVLSTSFPQVSRTIYLPPPQPAGWIDEVRRCRSAPVRIKFRRQASIDLQFQVSPSRVSETVPCSLRSHLSFSLNCRGVVPNARTSPPALS